MFNLAYAMGTAQQGTESSGSMVVSFVPIIVMFAIFYFLLIKPQQKKQKDRETMLTNIKEGNNIITQGGMLGTICKIKEDIVTLQVADQVKIKILKSSISTIKNQIK